MVYPEVQAKAQAEIDRVIGRDRLPTLEDRQDLPYIDCILWECLRWNPGKSRTLVICTENSNLLLASSHTYRYRTEGH